MGTNEKKPGTIFTIEPVISSLCFIKTFNVAQTESRKHTILPRKKAG